VFVRRYRSNDGMRNAIKWDALIAAAVALLGWAFTAGALYQQQTIILRELQEVKQELRDHEMNDFDRHQKSRVQRRSADQGENHAASH